LTTHSRQGGVYGIAVSKLVTKIDKETGRGKPGTDWTLGAQIVEVEVDLDDYYYRIKRAASVIDVGQIINYIAAKGQIMGGMAMGLSFASREEFLFDESGRIRNPYLRQYPVFRFEENPEYIVDFVLTPQLDGPYGARGLGEHGLIGMPAALADALSRAVGVQLNKLPLKPESIWRAVKEGLK
jgi:CO/xanthine dehydrogenase Mo-binding subunit